MVEVRLRVMLMKTSPKTGKEVDAEIAKIQHEFFEELAASIDDDMMKFMEEHEIQVTKSSN